MRARYFSLIAFLLLASSCEEVVDADDIPFVEKLVVRGVLEAGRPIDTMIFTRTRPVNEDVNASTFSAVGVKGVVSVDGVDHPLQDVGDGRYLVPGITVEPGKTYRLTAEWNGLKVQASTLVPQPVTIEQATIDSIFREYYFSSILNVVFQPIGDQVYAISSATKSSRDDTSWYAQSFDWDLNIGTREDVESDGRIHLKQEAYYYGSSQQTGLFLYTFDQPYVDYYYSLRQDDDGPFSAGNGRLVRWNVKGDGIGMFIGRARTLYVFP